VLEIRDLHVSYGSIPGVERVSLEVREGELWPNRGERRRKRRPS